MQFASLGSGSRGNGTLIREADTIVLVDCGFSAKEAEKRLHQHQLSAAELTAIVVTHEHSGYTRTGSKIPFAGIHYCWNGWLPTGRSD